MTAKFHDTSNQLDRLQALDLALSFGFIIKMFGVYILTGVSGCLCQDCFAPIRVVQSPEVYVEGVHIILSPSPG